jgi:hypothetical protein
VTYQEMVKKVMKEYESQESMTCAEMEKLWAEIHARMKELGEDDNPILKAMVYRLVEIIKTKMSVAHTQDQSKLDTTNKENT